MCWRPCSGDLQRSGATLALDEPARDILRHPEGGFAVVTPSRTLTCEKVLITTGGRSYPGCGTTGDGYAWAAAFGHTIVPQRPALVPLTVQAAVGRRTPRHHDAGCEPEGITAVYCGSPHGNGRLDSRPRVDALRALRPDRPGPARREPGRQRPPEPDDRSPSKSICFRRTRAAFDEFLRSESLASGKKQLAVVLAEKLPRRLCGPTAGAVRACPPTARPRR